MTSPPLEALPPDGTRVDSSPTLRENGVVIPATQSPEPSAMSEVPHRQTIRATSVIARARNYLQANYRSIDFRFEIQT